MKKLLGAVFAVLALSATPAMAKQCIWNKGAFTLRVDWFYPGKVSMAKSTTDMYGADFYQDWTFTEQPVQTDWINLATGTCIDRGNNQFDAVLSVCGAPFPTRVVQYPADWPVTNRINCSIWKMFTPSLTQYLDIWGGVLNPQSGPGGGI